MPRIEPPCGAMIPTTKVLTTKVATRKVLNIKRERENIALDKVLDRSKLRWTLGLSLLRRSSFVLF